MKNKFLLIFCSAALLTVMNTSYASSLPGTSGGRFQMGDRKIVGGGKLCRGKFTGTNNTYDVQYLGGEYSLHPTAATIQITFDRHANEGGKVEIATVNGSRVFTEHSGRSDRDSDVYNALGTFAMNYYRFIKGDNRLYKFKGGEKFKAVILYKDSYQARKRDLIECIIPAKPNLGD
jgi:hypothetical protein